MIVLNAALLALGFLALVKGADIFVDGSAALAKRLGVSELVVGLTVVALGTSAPELAVSTSAALQGSNEIALSNVVGSNIFNLLGVLGLCAILHPVPVEEGILKRDFPFFTVAAALLIAVTGAAGWLWGPQAGMEEQVGVVSRFTGAYQLVLFFGYMAVLVSGAGRGGGEGERRETVPMKRCILFILLGLALVIAGGEAVVHGARVLAAALGMSETLIGLTVVAIGTSLPELVTSVVAAGKGETGLALGNVIGSNIFNQMFILSVSALIRPVAVNQASAWDLCFLLAVTVLTLLFALSGRRINRAEGAVMVLLYAASVVFAAAR